MKKPSRLEIATLIAGICVLSVIAPFVGGAARPNIAVVVIPVASTNLATTTSAVPVGVSTSKVLNGLVESIQIDLPASSTVDVWVTTSEATSNALYEVLLKKTNISTDTNFFLRRTVFHDTTGTAIPSNAVIAESVVLTSQRLKCYATNSTSATAKQIRFNVKLK